MTFLSDKTIKERFKKEPIICDEYGNNLFKEEIVEGNACFLKLGREITLTGEGGPSLITLQETDVCEIPPGQFAHLLINEFIHMPPDLMGFISIDTDIKYRGVVNISGFHIDPGWKGRLVFSVFNAGPQVVTIKQSDDLIHVWFAKLDKTNTPRTKEGDKIRNEIPRKIRGYSQGSVFSPSNLATQISKVEDKLTSEMSNLDTKIKEKMSKLEYDNKRYAMGIAVAAFIGFVGGVAIDIGQSYFDFHRGFRNELKSEVTQAIAAEIKQQLHKQPESKSPQSSNEAQIIPQLDEQPENNPEDMN